MPISSKIRGVNGPDVWKSFNVEDWDSLVPTVKEEFRRPEAVYDMHPLAAGIGTTSPPNVQHARFSYPCMKDCLVFLARGVIFVERQGAVSKPGYAYAMRDEEWLGLGGNAVVVIMEQGDMKGICSRKTREAQEKIWQAQRDNAGGWSRRAWTNASAVFRPQRRHSQQEECMPQ